VTIACVLQWQGPAAIIRVFQNIAGNLYEQKYLDQKVRLNYVSLLRDVEQFIQSIQHEKVVTFDRLMTKLVTADSSGQFGKRLSDAGLGTILQWLNIQVTSSFLLN